MGKILYLISSMNMGGAETLVKDYALLMDKELFDVKIISIDRCYHSANEEILERSGISVIYLSELRYSSDKKLNIFQKIYRGVARYYDLRKIIKNDKPDVLHAHLDIGNYLKCIPIKKWGIHAFYTVHNVPERFFDGTGQNKKKYKAFREIKRLINKEDLKLIALHDDMNRELRELFCTNQVFTVNNGINLDRFNRGLYNREEVRRSLSISDDTLLIGHVGRFHEQKNHELIINIFHSIQKQKVNSHLLLIGGGPLLNKIETQIKQLGLMKNVTILYNRNDIPQLMCAMDVFLFPSKWEGFGNVLIEAQSIGLHSVVSDKIPKEVIVNGNVSIISLDASIEEWTKEILNKKEIEVTDKIKKYDIRNIVLQLQHMYCGECK